MAFNPYQARVIKKLTQWDIRKKTGIHQSKLSLIENGYVMPTKKEKELISEVVGIPIDEIEWSKSKKTEIID